LAIAVRPLDGAIAAVTLGCFMVFAALKRAQVAMLLVVVAAGALPVAGLLVTNLLTTGRPLLFGYEVLWERITHSASTTTPRETRIRQLARSRLRPSTSCS
jgi:hypothetical protein